MQRLFSTFPDGWPGFGLLLLRLGLGAGLIYFGASALLSRPSEPIAFALDAISLACGMFLVAGLWTPVIGGLLAFVQVWMALPIHPAQHAESWMHAFFAVLSASAAMLGPGAWSIDARMFGRKRFDLDRIKRKNPSL